MDAAAPEAQADAVVSEDDGARGRGARAHHVHDVHALRVHDLRVRASCRRLLWSSLLTSVRVFGTSV